MTTRHEERYWIAINGPTCAISALPLCQPLVTPTPQQLLGFPTYEEAYEAQQVCLTAPMDKVRQFLAGLSPDVRKGRVRVIQPSHPQSPTGDVTMWTDSTEMHSAIQDTFIQKTSN